MPGINAVIIAPKREDTFTIIHDDKNILSISLTAPLNGSYNNIKWDSKTGIVSACINSTDEATRRLIPYTGNAYGALPVG
jgi:hypothetical protein